MNINLCHPKSYSRKIKNYIFSLSCTCLILGLPLYEQQPPASQIAAEMRIGWNIGNSLEAPAGETAWGNPKVDQQLIDSVSSAGFNTIRIPCAWDSYADQATLEINSDFQTILLWDDLIMKINKS